MVASPVIGAGLAFLLTAVILWTFRGSRRQPVNRRFRRAQILSTAAMAYSHGTQDAQKTMGVITLALVVTASIPSVTGI